MVSPNENERSEPSSPKRPRLEEATNDGTDWDSDSDWEVLSDDFRLLDKEWEKSEGFDVDFSNLRHTFGCGAVDLDDSNFVDEPDTNRVLLNRLSEMAIAFYNQSTNTNLELVKVLRANYHPSAAITLYITFEAKDLSDGNQTKPYQAVFRYLPMDIEVISCRPQP